MHHEAWSGPGTVHRNPSVLPPSRENGSLTDRIRQRRPRQLPLAAYVPGWIQALIQFAVFAISLWLLEGETRALPLLLLSMALGWSWFCLLMVGHDAMHQAFFAQRWPNGVVAFLTLDCLLFSRSSWTYGHNVVHHGRPYSREDRMYLRGGSVAGDMWNLLVMVLLYISWDVARLFQRPTWHEWVGMAVRVTWLWSLLPLALLPAILFLLLCGNYLGLLSHAIPVRRRETDPVLRQLRTTWDLFPGSFVAALVMGGLNAHATHHVYPSLPRGAQPLGARILTEEAGAQYRRVDTLAGLWTLFRLRRHCTLEVASIEVIAGSRALAGTTRVKQGDNAYVIDLRVTDRRSRQVTIAFDERRKADRRSGMPVAL